MKKKSPYTFVKHGKQKHFLGSYDALWRADDHLLLVQNRIYNQTYKRFYFSDIQGMIAQVTKQRSTYAFLLGIIIILSFLTMGRFADDLTSYIWLGISVLFSIIFAINWFRGPTCKATIFTRVQSQPLPLNRLKKARKVFEELRSDIEKHQGVLNPAEISKPIVIAPDKNREKISAKSRTKNKKDYSYGGGFHLAFFFALLTIGVLNGLQLYTQNLILVLLETILLVASMIAMVLALKNQHTSAMGRWLKINTWAALLLIFAYMGVSYIDLMVTLTDQPNSEGFQNPLYMVIVMAQRNPADYPFWKFSLMFHALSFSLVSIAGLVQSFLFQKRRNEEL